MLVNRASRVESLMRDSRLSPDDKPYVVAGMVVIALLLGGVAYTLDVSALDVWTALIVGIVLVAGSVPIFAKVARDEEDPWLFKILMAGLIVHLLFSMIRYFVIFVVYKGNADAGVYHEAGATFARHLRDGEPLHPIPVIANFPRESQVIGDVVGVFYVIVGPSAYAGFLFFSYICYWGQVLVVRAFRVAVPEGDHRRFTILCLFLPSLLFWPASIGKEALMIGCLGVTIYGGALLLAPRPRIRGAAYFTVGTLMLLMIRTHVAAMSIGALVVATSVGVIVGGRDNTVTALRHGRSQPDLANKLRASSARTRGVRLVGVLLLVVLALFASTRMAEQFNMSEESSEDDVSTLEQTLERTSHGGSEFEPVTITGPTKVVPGVISVLFRPFPWEARNLNALLAAGESALLGIIVIVGWRRFIKVPVMALRRPFLLFCAAYATAFMIGFSFIANFGILARQRVQVLPAVLVLFCLPPATVSLFGRKRYGKVGRDESPISPPVKTELVAHTLDQQWLPSPKGN